MNDPHRNLVGHSPDAPDAGITSDERKASGKPAAGSPISPSRLAERRRELELELARIRSEVSAARLQARAAELELMLQRLTDGGVSAGTARFAAETEPPAELVLSSPIPMSVEHQPSSGGSQQHFHSWDQVRAAMSAAAPGTDRTGTGQAAAPTDRPPDSGRRPLSHEGPLPRDVKPRSPRDTQPPSSSQPPPDAERARKMELRTEKEPTAAVARPDGAAPERHRTERKTDRSRKATPAPGLRDDDSRSSRRPSGVAANSPKPLSAGDERRERRKRSAAEPAGDAGPRVREERTSDDAPPKRKRTAAWLVSAAAHAGLFVVLTAMTLSVRKPSDQVALSAAVNQPQQTPVQTFSIETPEPKAEPAEPAAAEVVHELSPVGQLAAADLDLDASPTDAAAEQMLRETSPLSAISTKPDAKAATQFCGVSGGGNHFVYLVDSSGSMGEAFSSARAELLKSIDLLAPEQRFYVVFFDAEPDYMRLLDPDRDEPTSVLATPENKQRLRRWAMQIAINPGRAPYEPLRFALELRPDVIFLLSDGEFPQGIEELLQNENRIENLFGDSGPLSIVHTIGYHSRQGERRMRRIAAQNGGQYRHVPSR